MSGHVASKKDVAGLLKQGRRDEIYSRRQEQRNRRGILQVYGITVATPTHSQARSRARRLRQIAAGRLRP